MAFNLEGLNLTPFSKVQSSDATETMSYLPEIERKAKSVLLANKYMNDAKIEAAKKEGAAAVNAFNPQSTSWGQVGMNVLGTAAQAGLFDGGGNLFSGRGSSGTDAFGRDFDDPAAGFYGDFIEYDSNTPSNYINTNFLKGWG
jgi:hypothetical protein